jgi:hypothetical protein
LAICLIRVWSGGACHELHVDGVAIDDVDRSANLDPLPGLLPCTGGTVGTG